VWREVIVGKRFPIRQDDDAQRRREPRNFLGEPLRGGGLRANDGDESS
jgi:hypothetical protein